jgi:AGCS family alanine or glycine:cation symporter
LAWSLAGLAAFVIIGGIRRIGAVAEKLVPAMAVIYALACLFVILVNYCPGSGSRWHHHSSQAFAPSAAVGGHCRGDGAGHSPQLIL